MATNSIDESPVFIRSVINIKVGNRPPKDYFDLIKTQIAENDLRISGISSEAELLENLKMNCVPPEIMEMNFDDYFDFLTIRQKQIALKIRDYYFWLFDN
jgi:hypothetical protein